MNNSRYYDGFNGEPEIGFSLLRRSGEKDEISIWDGYFAQIMSNIEPHEIGWTALAYHYHLCTGWYDESPWLIENLVDAYEQLNEIDKDNLEFKQSKEILEILLNMLGEAIDNNYKVFITYN